MAEMPTAAGTMDLSADHAVRKILAGTDVLWGDGGSETRPSGPRIEFVPGMEKGIAASGAKVRAMGVVVPVGPGEGRFGIGLAQDGVSLGGKDGPPFFGGLGDWEDGSGKGCCE